MCEGFGLIVTQDTQYFVEPDGACNVSHTDILTRLGWQDNGDAFNRRFVRVEYPDWTPGSFKFDENGTLPGWVEENRDEIIARCNAVLEKAAPALAEYEKMRGTALAEYKKMCGTAYAEMIGNLKMITGYVKA